MENMTAPAKPKSHHHARLDNQKAQLDKHGNFAEVIIRTTPEASDLINMARLWEYVLIQADRQTRGYVAKTSRSTYDETHAEFEACIALLAEKLKTAADRHGMNFTDTNFISRIAQRYGIAPAKKKSDA